MEEDYPESFYSKIRGVTHKNPDGSDRQKIIRSLEISEPLILRREPRNPHGSTAIAVYNSKNQQIGYLSSEISQQFAPKIDNGGKMFATVTDLTGGRGESRGVNIFLDYIPPQRSSIIQTNNQLPTAPPKLMQLKCPSCGAQLPKSRADEFITCPYCGTSSIFDSAIGKLAIGSASVEDILKNLQGFSDELAIKRLNEEMNRINVELAPSYKELKQLEAKLQTKKQNKMKRWLAGATTILAIVVFFVSVANDFMWLGILSILAAIAGVIGFIFLLVSSLAFQNTEKQKEKIWKAILPRHMKVEKIKFEIARLTAKMHGT